MQRLALRSTQLTAVFLVASVALIGPALAGVGASLPLALLLAVAVTLLYVGRADIAAVGWVGWIPLGPTLRVAWLGAILALVLVVVSLGATTGELQAYGGLCGLAGMVNYFLRPLYGLVIAAWRYVDRALGGTRGR
jgi:hypothetical protein